MVFHDFLQISLNFLEFLCFFFALLLHQVVSTLLCLLFLFFFSVLLFVSNPFLPIFLPFFVLLSSSSLLFSAFFCNVERIGSMSCLRFCGLFVFFLIKKILAFLFVFNRLLTFSGGLFFQLLLKVVCPQLIRLCS